MKKIFTILVLCLISQVVYAQSDSSDFNLKLLIPETSGSKEELIRALNSEQYLDSIKDSILIVYDAQIFTYKEFELKGLFRSISALKIIHVPDSIKNNYFKNVKVLMIAGSK